MYDYGDAYILLKGNITVAPTRDAAPNNVNKNVIFKNCAPFTNCIIRINNRQIGDAHDIDVVIPMYKLIEYSDNCSKTSGILWEYCKDVPAVDDHCEIVDFNESNATTRSLNGKW